MRVKMSKQPPPAPTASAVGPCPTIIKIVGRPSIASLPSTFAPPDHPQSKMYIRPIQKCLDTTEILQDGETSELNSLV